MKLGSGPARSSLHTLNVAFHRAMWDRRAISRAPQYLFQCGLATLVPLVVLIGGLLTIILHSSFVDPIVAGNRIIFDVMAALSLGLSILLMVVTNTEHPPAAGTALGLILEGFSWNLVLFVLLSALLMSLIRIALRKRMTNLL